MRACVFVWRGTSENIFALRFKYMDYNENSPSVFLEGFGALITKSDPLAGPIKSKTLSMYPNNNTQPLEGTPDGGRRNKHEYAPPLRDYTRKYLVHYLI